MIDNKDYTGLCEFGQSNSISEYHNEISEMQGMYSTNACMQRIIRRRDLISEMRGVFSSYKKAVAEDCRKAKSQPTQPKDAVASEGADLSVGPFPIFGALLGSVNKMAETRLAASMVSPQSAKADTVQSPPDAEPDNRPEGYASALVRRAKGAVNRFAKAGLRATQKVQEIDESLDQASADPCLKEVYPYAGNAAMCRIDQKVDDVGAPLHKGR